MDTPPDISTDGKNLLIVLTSLMILLRGKARRAAIIATFLAIVSLGTSSRCGASEVSDKALAASLLRSGADSLAKQDYVCARTLGYAAVAYGAKFEGWRLQARAARGLGDAPASVYAYEQAVALGGAGTTDFRDLAQLYLETGEPRQALWALELAQGLAASERDKSALQREIAHWASANPLGPLSPFAPRSEAAIKGQDKVSLRYYTISAVKDPPVLALTPDHTTYTEKPFNPHPEWRLMGVGNRAKKAIVAAPVGTFLSGITLTLDSRPIRECAPQLPVMPARALAHAETEGGQFLDRIDLSRDHLIGTKSMDLPEPARRLVVYVEEQGLEVASWSLTARLTQTPPSTSFAGRAPSIVRLPLASAGAFGHALVESPSGDVALFYLDAGNLWMTAFDDRKGWQSPRIVPVANGITAAPGVVRDDSGRYHLVWTAARGDRSVLLSSESDDGKVWTSAEPIELGIPQTRRVGSDLLDRPSLNSVGLVKDSRGFLLMAVAQYGFIRTSDSSARGAFVYLARSTDFRSWVNNGSVWRGDIGTASFYTDSSGYRIVGQNVMFGGALIEGRSADGKKWTFADPGAIPKGQNTGIFGLKWLRDDSDEGYALFKVTGDGIQISRRSAPGTWVSIDPTRTRIYGYFDVLVTRRHGILLAWSGDRDEDKDYVQIRKLPYDKLSRAGDAPGHWIEVLRAALFDPDELVRRDAAFLLRDRAGAVAVPELIRALRGDISGEVRAFAADTLWILADRRAGPAMADALSDPSVRVRAFAASGVQVLSDARAVPALLRILGEPDDGYQIHARALESLHILAGQGRPAALAAAPLLHDSSKPIVDGVRTFIASSVPSMPYSDRIALAWRIKDARLAFTILRPDTSSILYAAFCILVALFFIRRRRIPGKPSTPTP